MTHELNDQSDHSVSSSPESSSREAAAPTRLEQDFALEAFELFFGAIVAQHGTNDHAWLVRCALDNLKAVRALQKSLREAAPLPAGAVPPDDKGPHIRAIEYARSLVAPSNPPDDLGTPIEQAMIRQIAQHWLAGYFAALPEPTIEEVSGSIDFGEGFKVGEYLDEIRGEAGAVPHQGPQVLQRDGD